MVISIEGAEISYVKNEFEETIIFYEAISDGFDPFYDWFKMPQDIKSDNELEKLVISHYCGEWRKGMSPPFTQGEIRYARHAFIRSGRLR